MGAIRAVIKSEENSWVIIDLGPNQGSHQAGIVANRPDKVLFSPRTTGHRIVDDITQPIPRGRGNIGIPLNDVNDVIFYLTPEDKVAYVFNRVTFPSVDNS